jgi:hypothetical protein
VAKWGAVGWRHAMGHAMTMPPRTVGRGAVIGVIAAGILAVLGSAGDWATCSTTGCDGFLQAFSWQSGVEFGHGLVSGVAGILLVLVGLDLARADGALRSRGPAVGLALVIFGTVAVFVVGYYLIADGSLHVSGPPAAGALMTGIGGVLGLVAAWRIEPIGAPSA